MAGFPLKKPTGFRVKPADSTGMTGKSSGRTMWVSPKQCHNTGSLPDLTDRSCIVFHHCRLILPALDLILTGIHLGQWDIVRM